MSIKWDLRFLKLAKEVATWSKDQSTKVGAVIIGNDKVPGPYGYNGFPRGIDDTVPVRHTRPAKYEWTEHAERNAIYNAARSGFSLIGCTMYVTHMPCPDCARGIIQSGITTIVVASPDKEDAAFQKRWDETCKVSIQMLKEANVEIRLTDVILERNQVL